jgi:putative ABC transport system substrate-binding protein
MNRRAALLGLASLSLSLPATAQGARRRVGILVASTNDAFVAGLRKALREEGYEEGRNLDLVIRDGKGQPPLIEQAARDLVAARVEVIVAWATGAAQAAGRATRTIPIVAQVADAVGAGIVGSLARPEGNITGISSLSFDFAAKRVELLLEALPRARVLGFVGLRGEPNQQRFFEIARRATRPGVEQRMIEIDGVDGFEAAVTAVRGEIDGLTMQQIFYPESARIGEVLRRLRVPACGADRTFTEAGGLMAFDAYLEQGYQRMASYVEQLLAGTPISKLPFEQLSRTYLVLNMRAAAELGIAVPPTLLARADEVIE